MSLKHLSFRDLQYILAVAEMGSVSRAAEASHISQPALSERIKRIESILDTTLFRRTGTKTTPTDQGQLLIEHARTILDQVNEVDELLAHEVSLLSKTLRLGIIATLGPYLMPLLLPVLRDQHPALELILHEGLTEALMDQLKQGELDAVIAAAPLMRKGVRTYDLFQELFVLAMPKGHRLEKKAKIHARDLNGSEMVLLEDGHCLSGQALNVCPAKQRKQNKRLHAMSLETLKQMVATGAGYTLLPELSLPQTDPFSNLISYKKLADKKPFGRDIVLATMANESRRADFAVLSETIRNVVPESYLVS
ncbi:MAG: LysR family transcriptional regulator [Gammaproteobacteria bacterium]|nr:LysR family transcriptional regulator [Gammaproteobacteria bacterium]MBT4494535.1 LysR family transcriptional regulator [Gammaproteobacteria bacterium]MBT7370825.1 LysR family transcriptional regulator [Gammaproteobacteria bacterium]